MHLDLIESLRCPNPHDDGWLIAIPDVVRGRVMQSGEIGCPQCSASWRVHDGVLVLSRAGEAPATLPTAAPPDASTEAEAAALRTAALLDLRTPGGTVLLASVHAHHAAALAELVPDVLVLTLNAPSGAPNVHGHLIAHAPLPLGVGTLRGARLDAAHTNDAWWPSVRRAIARNGRLIAPAGTAVTPDLRELARDDAEWVAEVRVEASGLVPLRRGGDPLAR